MNKPAALALALLLGALWSCESQPQMTGRMVDPTVTEVSGDGKTAKVNMGSFDGLHGGQRLYVARQNKLVGMLAVRTMDAYSSECIVIASSGVTEGDAEKFFGTIRPGDVVHKNAMGLTRPGMPAEQVPRMVPTPYEAQEKPVDTTGNSPADSGQPTVKQVQPPVIPRDQVEDWIKTHPKPKTN